MFNHASEYGLDPQEAALLGWVHDLGYMIGDNRTHAKIGGDLLRSQGYVHWKEVAAHGTMEGLNTTLGILLNKADMSVDSRGDLVSFEARLENVADRYGVESLQVKECTEVINAIKSLSN
jgi:HD superfamily phosphodiesterase